MTSSKFNNKIPDLIYKELIDLFGQEKTDRMVENDKTDFRSLTILIFAEKFKRKFGINLWIIILLGLLLWIVLTIS